MRSAGLVGEEDEDEDEGEDDGEEDEDSEEIRIEEDEEDLDDDEEGVEEDPPLPDLIAAHLARLQATILQPLPRSIVGAASTLSSNVRYGRTGAEGRTLRMRRWARDVSRVLEREGDGREESDQPGPSRLLWHGGLDYDGWFEDWDVNSSSQRGRATFEEEREPFATGSQYALTGAGAAEPDVSRRAAMRIAQGASRVDGEEDEEDEEDEPDEDEPDEDELDEDEDESDASQSAEQSDPSVNDQESSDGDEGDGGSDAE